MKRTVQVLGIAVCSLLFLAVPLMSATVIRIDTAGAAGQPHPASYHYSYRYYRPVKEAGSRQCYWYYTNGSYVYVCR